VSLVLDGGLGFDARRSFIDAARAAIIKTDQVALDCSAADTVDDAVIGMLATLARAAQRRGGRVTLIGAPRSLHQRLEAAHVAAMFDWALTPRPNPH
jgi:anti-anti-sigma regulatory factor